MLASGRLSGPKMATGGTHIDALGVAAGDFDLDRVVREAEAAARDAREARDFLGWAGSWRPGRKLVRHARAWADATVKAANLMKVAVRRGDPKVVKKATRQMEGRSQPSSARQLNSSSSRRSTD